MKNYSKIIGLFLCITLSVNTTPGFFSYSTILTRAYSSVTSFVYDYPKSATILGAITLASLFGCYYFYAKNKQKNSKAFPLEKLPKDIQNEIASYLTFNKLESDQELINILNKPSRKTVAGSIILEGKKFKVEISSDRKIAKLIKKNYLFNTVSRTLIDFTDFYNATIIDAEVSPNFKKLILLIASNIMPRLVDFEKIVVIDLKDELEATTTISFPNYPYHYTKASTSAKAIEFINKGYFCSGYRYPTYYLTKLIDHVAVSDNRKIAYSDSMGIYYYYRDDKSNAKEDKRLKKFAIEPFDVKKMSEQTTLEIIKNNKQRILVDRLEFNKQGTKLGVKYKNGKTEILPLPGAEQKQKTLQQYFYENRIKKDLKHCASITNK